MLAYGRKTCGLWQALGEVRDTRKRPRIPSSRAVRAVLVMCLIRMGSLNALEQTKSGYRWRRSLGGDLPSADTVGRVFCSMDLEALRDLNRRLYAKLKRNKALEPPNHGLIALVIDGHESHATYDRKCAGCLSREVTCKEAEGGKRVQYYHRYVTGILVAEDLNLLLDLEPIRPGEDEIAAALRLLSRLLVHFPRAFDVVLGDGLYARSDFFNAVIEHGKYALAVLKNEERDLMEDARSLWPGVEPQSFDRKGTAVQAWDMEGFKSWPQVQQPVRVVRTLETSRTKRQLTGEVEETTSEWVWVGTLPMAIVRTQALVDLGHARWTIENQGFNETANEWHADHVYVHDAHAMLAVTLVTYIAYNLFHAFWQRNLKPVLRARYTMRHIAQEMMAAFRSRGVPSQARCPAPP